MNEQEIRNRAVSFARAALLALQQAGADPQVAASALVGAMIGVARGPLGDAGVIAVLDDAADLIGGFEEKAKEANLN